MDVDAYLVRIGYFDSVQPNRATLEGLMQAHLRSVPFENLDQQLGVPVTTNLADIYEKVVLRNRGGWCFELNQLFGWLLQEIGFEVSFLAGYVLENKPTDRFPEAFNK